MGYLKGWVQTDISLQSCQVVLQFNRGMSDPDGDGEGYDCIPAVDNFQVIWIYFVLTSSLISHNLRTKASSR